MLIIDNKIRLLTLWRALLTLKFECPVEDAAEYAGSAILSEVLHQISEAYISAESDEANFGNAGGMDTHLLNPPPMVLEAIQNHIQFSKLWWDKCERKQKAEFVETLLSPFVASSELVDSIIKTADK